MNIELQSVTKSYTDGSGTLTVLDTISATFSSERSSAILGSSGVGKSTLLHLLGVLDKPTSGDILFGGRSLLQANQTERAKFRGENIGFIYQFHHLLPEFNALENVGMPLVIAGVSYEEAMKQAKESLYTVGLKDREGHVPSQLSGGEQQRVALARATVMKPSILLADEPTGNLDAENSNIVEGLLHELKAACNCLLIVVTHSTELASRFDDIYQMGQGGVLNKKG